MFGDTWKLELSKRAARTCVELSSINLVTKTKRTWKREQSADHVGRVMPTEATDERNGAWRAGSNARRFETYKI